MTKKKTKNIYLTYQDTDGCDDLLVIYDAKTGKDILSIPYWAEHADWADRTVAKANLLIANPKLLLSLKDASESEIDAAIRGLRTSTVG